MKNQPPNEAFETEHKIAALIRTLRAAEQELHVLTHGRLHSVASESGQPYLLRAAQEKLLHSEAAQRQLAETQMAILNALPAHIALVDPQGVIISVNEAWRRFAAANVMSGSDFGVGQNYLEICEHAQGNCAQEANDAANGIRCVLAGKAKEFSVEYPCHSPGEQRWFRLMVTPLYEGQPGGAVVMHVNVTERRLAEESLRESEARYRLLFESNPQPMWVYDLDTWQFLAVNRAAIDHYGYAEAEFLRMTIADIRPTEDVPALREALANIQGGISHSGVWRHRRKDGQLMMMEVSSHPLSFARHRAQLALMADVTERQLVEHEVEHLAAFAQMNPNPVLEFSAVGKVIYFNDAARTMARAAGQEHPAQILPPGMPDLVRDCLQTNQPRLRLERELAGRVISWSFFPIQPLQVVHGYAGDITERKKSEAALTQSEHEQRELAQMLEAERARLIVAQAVAKVGSWETNLTSFTVIWSAQTHRIFETDPQHFQPTHEAFLQLVHSEDRAAVDVAFNESLGQTAPGVIEHRVLLADGRVKFVEEHWQVLRDGTGRPVRAVGTCQDITERRQIEDALRKKEALLRIAGQAAHLGGWTIELPKRKLFWSDEICAIHDVPPGYTPTFAEGIGFFMPEHRTEITRLVEACAKDGTPYDVELPKLTAKGRKIWVRTIGEAVRDAEGKIIRLQGAFQDITARKLAELELAHANRALRLISLCNAAIVHATDEKQLLTDICRLAVETGGYQMAWVGYAQNDEGRTIAPMAHAGEERGYLSQIKLSWLEYEPSGGGPAARAIRSGHAVVCPDITDAAAAFSWQDAARERGYRSVICLPLRDDEHGFGLLTLYSSEISQPSADELKLLQELADDLAFGICSLRTREQHRITEQKNAQQAALLDKAQDAILVRDLDHRITFWNKSAERLYGWSAAEVIGRSAHQLLYRHAAEFEKAMAQVLTTGEWSGELRQMTRQNRELIVEGRWTLLQDEQGQPRSILAINTDVTEKKKLEAQFLRSQRMEGIGTLAGGIAHDLNNVLAPIMISVQMLKQDARDAETLKLLDTLEICSKRGANLVKQVLSFARGVDGQRVLIQPAHLVRELQHVLQEIFPKNIAFDFAAPRDLWPVTGDPTQLHQVILNLCVNARDAMPDGGNLKITMENVVLDETYAAMNPDSRAGSFVVVTVADTGTGIPPETLNKIFEPFFTTKEMGKGTGLGLSTVLGIVKSHGGFITVSSEPCQGSKFKVYLPANPMDAAGKTASAQPHLPRGNGELVLVVDDEESIRKVVQKTLERFGYRVILASNGAEAVSLYAARRQDIALVLTDMMMPIMDGPTLVMTLKAMHPQVRIIASSGMTTNEGVAKVEGAGVRHFVPKPYTTETMLKTIHQELTEPVGDDLKC